MWNGALNRGFSGGACEDVFHTIRGLQCEEYQKKLRKKAEFNGALQPGKPAFSLQRVEYIAGLGPIFGAMQGALWGTDRISVDHHSAPFFAGGVHDYFSGMISERNDGASIAECGIYLGGLMQNVMRVFSVVLLSWSVPFSQSARPV